MLYNLRHTRYYTRRARGIAPMDEAGSVTYWLTQLPAGDPAAAQHLWERYFQRLVGLARKRLQGAGVLGADEEDVALSAFNSFFRNAQDGHFPQLVDRDNLWQLLVTITARKACHLLRDARREKRGGDRQREEADLDRVVGREPSPEFAAQIVEEFRCFLDQLNDPFLRTVVVGKMEGFTNSELAARLGVVPRTIERKLRIIRATWERTAT
jgi:DNA-directed RNA polymerase specialized sigma24 family protein